MRQEVNQKLGNALDKFDGLRKRPDILGNRGISPGKLLETGDVIRVGEKSHIEDQVAVLWKAVAKPEAVYVNHDVRLAAAAAELFFHERPQLVDSELRRIDDEIRHERPQLVDSELRR